MKLLRENIFRVMLVLTALTLFSSQALAQDQSPKDEARATEEESSTAVPDLADIVPLASELSGRLAELRNELSSKQDTSAIESKCAELEENLSGLAAQLEHQKKSKTLSYTKLVELRQLIEKEHDSLGTVTKPLRQSVSQLGAWRKEWSEEKAKWSKWASSFIEEEEIDELKSIFTKANNTIDTALNLVLPQLKELLTVQKKAGGIGEKIFALTAELDSLMLVVRKGVLLEASPPMLSSKYFSQFGGGDLWHVAKVGLHEISWSTTGLLDRLGSVVFLQILISLAVIMAIFRNRQTLKDSPRWKFLDARPVSAGLFVGIVTTMWFYEYEGIPPAWILSSEIVGGASLARLLGSLLESRWKQHFVYGVIFVWILGRVMYFINLPLPLFRLYSVAAAILAIVFLRSWATQSQSDKESDLYAWSLRLGSLFFGFVVLAQLAGKKSLAALLFLASLRSIVEILGVLLVLRLILGALEYLFHRSLLRHMKRLHADGEDMVRRVTLFIGFLVTAVLLLPYLLNIWGVYDTFQEALSGFLALGFPLGSQEITVAHLIIVAVVLFGTSLVSGILQGLLLGEALVKRRMEKGVRISIARLVHYFLLFIGFLLVLWILGFEFTKVVIVLSALGVGIGFGLQSIVNNFLSGLILLFERPIRVGDFLEVGGQWVEVKHIGLRATTVQSFDQADVIIPNADLVTSPVTNWTLSNRQVRLRIPVGVAYGSNVPLVMKTLLECVKEHTKVVEDPSPQVLFLSFGESSLDFELRVWVVSADERLAISSELHQEIDRRFREAGVVIAFPQRDLHLRTVDETVVVHSAKSAE